MLYELVVKQLSPLEQENFFGGEKLSPIKQG
jgi:hypothetical protein